MRFVATRTLVFPPDSKRFELLHNALMQSPVPIRGSTERRMHGELLDKLEGIGSPRDVLDPMTGRPRDHRKDELVLYECIAGGTINISDAEYDFVKRHVTAFVDWEGFPKAWSRDGQALLDYLEALTPNEDTATAA